MRIVISTLGRFHSFDLAAELQKAGCLTAIFSGYPRFKLRDTGVDADLIHTVPWLQTPYMGLMRTAWFPGSALERSLAWRARRLQDRIVARRLPPCDVVSAMSSLGLATGLAAHAMGAAYVCERSSSHIRFQDRLLREEHERMGIPYRCIDPRVVDLELREYDAADRIMVPSEFVKRSFLEMGSPASKLCVVPQIGVDTAAYRPGTTDRDAFRILFVGALGLRKGLTYLLEAVRLARLPRAKLVLVGDAQPETARLLSGHSMGDVDILGRLPRSEVARQMARASVFVLPSIEEGLAQVQVQALASGCPVIATPNSGAENLFTDGVEGFVVPIRDPDALADRLTRLHDDAALRARMAAAAVERIAALGGRETYGRLAVAAFREIVAIHARGSAAPEGLRAGAAASGTSP